MNAFIDCIASNNLIDDKSYSSRKIIQDGYVQTGEISKTSDGKGYNSCPDLYALVSSTKNPKILKNKDLFISNLKKLAKTYYAKGSLDELEFYTLKDGNGEYIFPKDDFYGIEMPKQFTSNQFHLMRTMLPHHAYWREKSHHEQVILKEKLLTDMEKKYSVAMQTFTLNAEAETDLKSLSSDGTLSSCTLNHFFTLKMDKLRSFVKVRYAEDIYDESKKLPNRKGSMADVGNNTGSPKLLEMAFVMRDEPVIAQHPAKPTLDLVENITRVSPIPVSEEHNVLSQFEFFEVNEVWIENAKNAIENDFKEEIPTVEQLKDSTCAETLRNRLHIHLKKFNLDPTDSLWHFFFKNFDRMSVLLKLLGYVQTDNRLKNAPFSGHLFNTSFLHNHELHQIGHSSYHGCYLVKDGETGDFIRAGSASNKLGHVSATGVNKGRINEHLKASMNPMASNSRFYDAYPHEDAQKYQETLKKGTFQQLQFIAPIRFREGKKDDIQSLFEWDKEILDYLERRKPSGCETLKDKKHRIVCYLCEMVMQMCLRPSDNISSNPGCEAFALVYDKGYDDVDMNLAKQILTEDIDIVEFE